MVGNVAVDDEGGVLIILSIYLRRELGVRRRQVWASLFVCPEIEGVSHRRLKGRSIASRARVVYRIERERKEKQSEEVLAQNSVCSRSFPRKCEDWTQGRLCPRLPFGGAFPLSEQGRKRG